MSSRASRRSRSILSSSQSRLQVSNMKFLSTAAVAGALLLETVNGHCTYGVYLVATAY